MKDAANYETKPGQKLGDINCKLRTLNWSISDEYLIDGDIAGITDENLACTDAKLVYAYLNAMESMPSKSLMPSTIFQASQLINFDFPKETFKKDKSAYNHRLIILFCLVQEFLAET